VGAVADAAAADPLDSSPGGLDMSGDFLQGVLGRTGMKVCRLGLAASYRPGERAVRRALDEGVNFCFCFGIDTQMTRVLRSLSADRRDRIVIATGAYNYIGWRQDLERTLEKRLRQLRTDRIDVFHFLGVMKPGDLTPRVRDQLAKLRADPRVRAVSISCHDRRLAGQLAADGALDCLMIRYNAAHRGAETEIFPRLAGHDPGLVSYTATRWRGLLRRTRDWPADGPIPTAGQCYRFVLSNPHVDVCLTAPRNERELEENLAAVRLGALPINETGFLRAYGDAVHRRAGWFMQPSHDVEPAPPRSAMI
jgi:aryl-alcohol dehydrogenase-like predicted oxidoreductase